MAHPSVPCAARVGPTMGPIAGAALDASMAATTAGASQRWAEDRNDLIADLVGELESAAVSRTRAGSLDNGAR